jgi:hypothetical protein
MISAVKSEKPANTQLTGDSGIHGSQTSEPDVSELR